MKLSDKDKKLLVKALAFIIPFITILIGFIIGGFAPFGNKDIMTAAGYEDMIPYLTEFHDLVSSGNPFVYSNRIGTGYDFSAVITYYLSDPTNLIILFFPKASMLAVIDILYVIKISLAGLFAYFMFGYLSQSCSLNTKDYSMSFLNLGLALAYALSSAMVGYGMNITWLSAMAILPLVIMGLEKIIRERKPIMYLVTFAITILCSFNMAIIVFIFSLLYIIRPSYKSTRHVVITLLYKLASDILATGVTMFIILNNINSSFFKVNTSLYFPLHMNMGNIFDFIKSQMTHSPISVNSAFGKGIDIYAGVFIIFFLVLYIMNKNINPWSKLRALTIYSLLVIGTFLTTAQYALNGLNNSFLTKSVFGFTFVLYSLMLIHELFMNIDILKMRHFLISGGISIALIIADMILCSGYDSSSPFITSLEVIIALTIISIIWQNKNINLNKYKIIILIVMAAELIYSNVSNVSALGNAAIPYNRTVTCAIDTCSKNIHETDKDARILVYNPYHTDATPVSEAILGYDYILVTGEMNEAESNLEYQDDLYGISVYTNPDAIKNGIYARNDILNWDSTNEFYFSAINIMTRDVFGAKNVFEQTECNTSIDNNTYSDSSLISFNTRDSGDFYTNLSKVIHVGEIKAGAPATIRYFATFEDSTAINQSSEYVIFNQDAYKDLLTKLTCAEASCSSDSKTSLQINAPEEGYLMIPSDISSCSNITINNDKAKKGNVIHKNVFSNNVTLVRLNKGSNTIDVFYKPYHFIHGFIMSIICLFIIIITIVALKKDKIKSFEISENVTKLEKIIYSNRVYIFTIIISTLLYLAIACYKQAVPFGTSSMIVSDGYVETYPTFMSNINDFKHLNFSTINYTIGFMGEGLNLSSFLFFINPLRIIPLFFPAGHELLAFNTLYAVEYILIGPSIILYLTHRPHGSRMNKTELKLIPIALCYNLSSYVLCYFSFAGFLEMVLIFPIIMLALDRLIYEKKYIAYTVLLSLFMIDSVYMAFLMCEFLALYFFTMDHGSIKEMLKNGIRFALASVTSALMAIFTLLPFYGSVSNTNYSSYDSGEVSTSLNIFTQNIIGNLKDTEVLHRLSIVTDNWNIANTYCGLLLLLIIPLYLMNNKIKLSIRIRNTLLAALLYFSYGNEVLNFVFHGFHKQAQVPNRFSPFLIFIMVNIIYELIINYKEFLEKKKLIVYAAFSILIAALTIYNHNGDTKHRYIISIIFIGIYLAGYIYFYFKKKHYNYIRFALATLAAELMITSIFTGSYVWGIDASNETNMNKLKTLSAKYSLAEDGLMHTEVLNGNNINSSCLIGTNSISVFSSTLPTEKTRLVETWNLTGGMNNINYGSGNPLANIMFNTKYYYNNIFSDNTEAPTYFEKVDELSNIVLYKDPYVVGSGIYFQDDLKIQDIKKSNFESELEFQNAISNALVGQDLYNIIEYTTNESEFDENHSYILLQETEADMTTPIKIYTSKDISGTLYLAYDDIIEYLGEAEEGTSDYYDITVHEYREGLEQIEKLVAVGTINTDTMKKLSEYIDSTRLKDLKTTDNVITGTSNKETSGTLYIPLPNYTNWHAYIDDQEVEKEDYMGGIGIHIPSGKHTIKLEYIRETNTIPYILSCIFIILFIQFCIVDSKRKHKNNAIQQQDKAE